MASNIVSSASMRRSCTRLAPRPTGRPGCAVARRKRDLTALINRGKVNCEARATDRFGRVVAVCSAEGVPDLGEALVRDGYAIDLGGAAGNPYRDAEAEAEAAKRGIWRGTFERPSDWRQANPREVD